MPSQRRVIGVGATLALAVVLGGLGGWLLTGGRERGSALGPDAGSALGGRDAAALAGEIDTLRAILELEMEKRGELEREVALLGEVLSDLDGGDGGGAQIDMRGNPGPPVDRGSGEPTTGSEAATPPVAALGAEAPPGRPEPAFDRDGLSAAGIHEADVQALYERWTQLEMDKLYLSDEARREGWAGTGRFRRARRALGEAVRNELDEDTWDQWLYATGNNNRLVVGDVLDSSAGERAGLQPGDQIIRYAGQRVHSVRDVRQRTAEGIAGEQVRVEVRRGGGTLYLGVERGPIGAILKERRETPVIE